MLNNKLTIELTYTLWTNYILKKKDRLVSKLMLNNGSIHINIGSRSQKAYKKL